MFMILETLAMLGIVIGGVVGTGYLGVLFCAKVAEMDDDPKPVRKLMAV